MASQRGAVRGAHVEVGRVGVGCRGEGFPARHAQVALVVVAEWLESPDDRGEVVAAGDHHIEIDDRLGGKVGDGGAADVLDPGHQGAEGGGDAVAQLHEDARPTRVVLHDHDRVDHRARSPRSYGWRLSGKQVEAAEDEHLRAAWFNAEPMGLGSSRPARRLKSVHDKAAVTDAA
jgi:hypothetical protein